MNTLSYFPACKKCPTVLAFDTCKQDTLSLSQHTDSCRTIPRYYSEITTQGSITHQMWMTVYVAVMFNHGWQVGLLGIWQQSGQVQRVVCRTEFGGCWFQKLTCAGHWFMLHVYSEAAVNVCGLQIQRKKMTTLACKLSLCQIRVIHIWPWESGASTGSHLLQFAIFVGLLLLDDVRKVLWTVKSHLFT